MQRTTKYVAFLRAINVGGKNLIKMLDLKKIFESAGMRNVSTYIQSGNVIFESNLKEKEVLESKIEKKLHKSLSTDVLVFTREVEELNMMIDSDPFQKLNGKGEGKFYVTFLKDDLKPNISLPYFSSKKDVEIIHCFGGELYSISHEVKGQFGFPNLFIEKEFKVKATTRNWNTLNKIVDQIS